MAENIREGHIKGIKSEGMKAKELREFKKNLRQAIADYMASEGCSCCQDRDAHRLNTERLGKLLRVPKYPDGSGYDFSKYKSKSV